MNYKGRYYGNNLKSSINYLKGVVGRGGANEKEEGYVTRKIMNLDGTYNLRSDVLPVGSDETLPLKSGGYVVGTFHSHPYKGDSMYSFGDLKHLLNLYDKAPPLDRRYIFEGMVARDPQDNNNVYMLKVDDIEKLRKHIKDIEDSEKYLNLNPGDRLEKIHEEQALLYHKSNGQKEKSFLQQFPNAGISIYKANADVSNFSKLTLDNDNVISIPCN